MMIMMMGRLHWMNAPLGGQEGRFAAGGGGAMGAFGLSDGRSANCCSIQGGRRSACTVGCMWFCYLHMNTYKGIQAVDCWLYVVHQTGMLHIA